MEAIIEYFLTHIPHITLSVFTLSVVGWIVWNLRGTKDKIESNENVISKHLASCAEEKKHIYDKLDAVEVQLAELVGYIKGQKDKK